jgi:FixJ family two-component response regulator
MNENAIVHVIDDDESLRGAVSGLLAQGALFLT